jgi:predicted metal-binding protein
MELSICAVCRKKPGETCDSLRDLVDEARAWAHEHHQKLPIKREPCLSGCIQGLTVLVETAEGSIRCQRVQTKAEMRAILENAEQKIHANVETPIDGLVLSRTNWQEWDAE